VSHSEEECKQFVGHEGNMSSREQEHRSLKDGSCEALSMERKKYKCDKCGMTFSSSRQFDKHDCERKVKGRGLKEKSGLICTLCEAPWRGVSAKHLADHLNYHHAKMRINRTQLEEWGVLQCPEAGCLKFL